MKKILFLVIALVSMVTIQAQTFNADVSKSKLKWTATKIVGGHNGTVALQSGTLTFKNSTITNGNFVIDMKTIKCNDITDAETNKKLITHLNSDDFFAVAKYPTAKIVITEKAIITNNIANIKGTLTIKGITKPIQFTANKNGKTYTAKIPVDRTVYDITYGSGSFFDNLGDNAISNEFILDVTIVLK